MQLKPKHIGDELSLDEYNAYQYLLYNMDCWHDEIYLNMETPYEGDYGTYLLGEETFLMGDKNGTYKIIEDLTNKSALHISILEITELLDKEHMDFTCTVYYKPPKVIDGKTYQPSDDMEYGEDEHHEVVKIPSIQEDFKSVELPCTVTDNIISIPLWDSASNKAVFTQTTLISEMIHLNIQLNLQPWIDLNNGRANDPYEILLNKEEQLMNVIEHAPSDGTLTIIRLDSNRGPYVLPKTLEISNGQNIEIRGGTSQYIYDGVLKTGNAVLDGTVSRRTFVVKFGGKLKLDHLTLQNNNVNNKGTYDIGRGGAVLVEAIRRHDGVMKYGVLNCTNCTFINNKATNGGAIFSYHAGLFLNGCDFISNSTSRFGGAVYYWARDTRLTFNNVIVVNGSTTQLKVKVTNYNSSPIGEGDVDFYLWDNGVEIPIGSVNVIESGADKGMAICPYLVPETNIKKTLQFVAHYRGGATYEDEVASCTATVIFAEEYTTKFTGENYGSLGNTVTLKAEVKDNLGRIITKPKGIFSIDGKDYVAQTNGECYTIKYEMPKKYDATTIPVKFSLEDSIYYKPVEIAEDIYVIEEGGVVNYKPEISAPITGIFVNNIDPQPIANNKNKYTDNGITTSMVSAWVNAGITDIFVRCVDYEIPERRAAIDTVFEKTKGKGFRIHGVVNCFCDVTVDENDSNYMNKRWGDVNPASLARRQVVIKNITSLLQNYSLDGICLDYIRFNGDETNSWNGNVTKSNRKTHVNSALEQFKSTILSIKKDCLISACLMPEEDAELMYGQKAVDMKTYVDYLIPLCHVGNYAIESNGSDNWIKGKLDNLSKTVDGKNILCSIQTYTSDKELDTAIGKGNPKTAYKTKTSMDTTMKAVAQAKVQGVLLYREGALLSYPINYRRAMEYFL